MQIRSSLIQILLTIFVLTRNIVSSTLLVAQTGNSLPFNSSTIIFFQASQEAQTVITVQILTSQYINFQNYSLQVINNCNSIDDVFDIPGKSYTCFNKSQGCKAGDISGRFGALNFPQQTQSQYLQKEFVADGLPIYGPQPTISSDRCIYLKPYDQTLQPQQLATQTAVGQLTSPAVEYNVVFNGSCQQSNGETFSGISVISTIRNNSQLTSYLHSSYKGLPDRLNVVLSMQYQSVLKRALVYPHFTPIDYRCTNNKPGINTIDLTQFTTLYNPRGYDARPWYIPGNKSNYIDKIIQYTYANGVNKLNSSDQHLVQMGQGTTITILPALFNASIQNINQVNYTSPNLINETDLGITLNETTFVGSGNQRKLVNQSLNCYNFSERKDIGRISPTLKGLGTCRTEYINKIIVAITLLVELLVIVASGLAVYFFAFFRKKEPTYEGEVYKRHRKSFRQKKGDFQIYSDAQKRTNGSSGRNLLFRESSQKQPENMQDKWAQIHRNNQLRQAQDNSTFANIKSQFQDTVNRFLGVSKRKHQISDIPNSAQIQLRANGSSQPYHNGQARQLNMQKGTQSNLSLRMIQEDQDSDRNQLSPTARNQSINLLDDSTARSSQHELIKQYPRSDK